MRGHKGDFVYETTGNELLDFFSRAGSIFKNQRHHHGNAHDGLDLFRAAWYADEYKAMQLAMWLRDCRGGTGNRSGFRDILTHVAKSNPEWIKANIHFIPQVGRWDDLLALMDTPCENEAIALWAEAIANKNGLAAKWSPREKKNKIVYHKLRKHLRLSPPEFRKLMVESTNVVETQMCSNKWDEIDYNHVPSVAMARSVNAFTKHDINRFEQWKSSLANPESGNKINASVLFPHDCIRTLRAELSMQDGYYTWSRARRDGGEKYGDSLVANAQFAALPNYMEKTDAKIMAICDFSGSMGDTIAPSSSISRLDVSMSLGLYCSDRLGKDNPFYRKFIPFSEDSRLVDWSQDTFSVAVQKYNDGYCGTTNIQAALDQILNSAKLMNATQDQMPTHLLIISDMQFDMGVNQGRNQTVVESSMKRWETAGYNRPKIVYWNLAGYKNSPAEFHHKDVALVSGFSPSLLIAILEGEDFTPMAIMEKAICKYEIVRPANYVKPNRQSDFREIAGYKTCYDCKGTGFIDNKPCHTCVGVGEVTISD